MNGWALGRLWAFILGLSLVIIYLISFIVSFGFVCGFRGLVGFSFVGSGFILGITLFVFDKSYKKGREKRASERERERERRKSLGVSRFRFGRVLEVFVGVGLEWGSLGICVRRGSVCF